MRLTVEAWKLNQKHGDGADQGIETTILHLQKVQESFLPPPQPLYPPPLENYIIRTQTHSLTEAD